MPRKRYLQHDIEVTKHAIHRYAEKVFGSSNLDGLFIRDITNAIIDKDMANNIQLNGDGRYLIKGHKKLVAVVKGYKVVTVIKINQT